MFSRHAINTIEFEHLAKHSYVEIKVKTHYVVHKMLSQGNFCILILNFVIGNMINIVDYNEKGLNITMSYII